MRDLTDAEAFAFNAWLGSNALVVVRGQLGLEAAGVQVKLGLPVTLLEAAVRILSQATSVHFRALHLAIQHYLADATILGRRASHNAKPWFWSGQNATKL